MYRCQTCRAVVPSGQPHIKHVVKRADGSVTRELSVCARCEVVLTGKPPQPLPEPKPTTGDE